MADLGADAGYSAGSNLPGSSVASVRRLYGSIIVESRRALLRQRGQIAILAELAMIAALVLARTVDPSRSFLGLWTTLLGALALISPSSALVVLLAMVPFSEWMVVGGVGMKVVIVAMIGMGLVLRWAFIQRRAIVTLPIKLAGVVLVATAISVLHTLIRMPELGASATVAWLAGIGGGLIVLMAAWAAAVSGNVRPAVAVIAAVAVGAAASLSDFLTSGDIREGVFGWLLRPDRLALPRVTGIIPAPNAVATVVLCASAVLGALLALGRGRRRLLLVVPLVMMAATIIFTFSRSGLLGMFAVGVLVIAYRRPRAAAVVLVAGLALSIVAIPAYLQFRTAALGSGSVVDLGALLSGDLKRLEGWAAALRMWRDEPLTGFGFLSFKALALNYGSTLVTAPHNEFLRVLAEGGIGVAIALIAFVAATVRALWRAHAPFALGALGALIAILLGGMFNNPFLYVQVTAPAFAIVGVALGSPSAFTARSIQPDRATRTD